MKKIGIMTFQGAINYGAVLQAVALQRKIEEIGGNCELIDYRNAFFKRIYGVQNSFKKKTGITYYIKFFLKNCMYFNKKRKFNVFLKKNSKISSRVYTRDNIMEANTVYDVLVTGSDQVFNLEMTEGDTAYFLDFAEPEKMRSYAASFGFSQFPEEEKDKYVYLLQRFYEVSVRENSGLSLCESIGVKAVRHVDPTLLLSATEWKRICNLKSRKSRNKYLLLYTVATPHYLLSYVKKFAKVNKLDIIEISDHLSKLDKAVKTIRGCGPEEFLSYIYNAEYVATTSFHAAVFSMLFQKNLFAEVVDKKGRSNVRILDLFTNLHIEPVFDGEIACVAKNQLKDIEETLTDIRNESEMYFRSL